MTELQAKTRDALLRVGTSTLTGALNRRGLRSMFMQDVWPVRPDMPRMVGIAFTMRRLSNNSNGLINISPVTSTHRKRWAVSGSAHALMAHITPAPLAPTAPPGVV
jgi:hypothetical protein